MAKRRARRQNTIALLVVFSCMVVACTVIAAAILHNPAPARAKANPGVQQTPVTMPVNVAAPVNRKPQVNFLLLGSDQREGDSSFRTDVIVLVTVKTENFTVSAVSFPRDLWVEPPTLYPMKINMVHGIGGFEATAAMFESNFAVRPDFYVLTNFRGFTRMVDRLGGINVPVGEPLSDSCDLPQAAGGICSLEPGLVHMDGATALWYVRSRDSTSDFDRLRRAQEVVQAAFARLMEKDALKRIPQLMKEAKDDIETNLQVKDISPLIPVAVRVFQEPERIRRFAVGEEQAYPTWSWDGMWILMPDLQAVQDLLSQAGVNLLQK